MPHVLGKGAFPASHSKVPGLTCHTPSGQGETATEAGWLLQEAPEHGMTLRQAACGVE